MKPLPFASMDKCLYYPLVNQQKAIEKLSFIADLPIKDGDFP